MIVPLVTSMRLIGIIDKKTGTILPVFMLARPDPREPPLAPAGSCRLHVFKRTTPYPQKPVDTARTITAVGPGAPPMSKAQVRAFRVGGGDVR